LTASLLAACGGGGGTGGTGGTGQAAVSTGVMTTGSVIVNGVRFDDRTANIRVDDTPGKLPADLKDGMVVKVRGLINADRVNGLAQQVEVENEVRGTVQTHNASGAPPSFTVIGQTVSVDDLTVFANFSSSTITAVGELVDGRSIVEVHGLRDSAGNVRASRVGLLNANPLLDNLHGTIKAATLTATTFTLQNGAIDVAVFYSALTISPATATLSVGASVEVHGTFNGTSFIATRVDVEAVEDAQFEHAAGEEFEVEGQVSGCGVINPCISFSVGTQAVQTNGSTRFENGSATDVADNVRVEAEGHTFNGTTLIAEKIQFKRSRVILTGTVTAVTGAIVNGTGNTGTITLLGKTVHVTTLAKIRTSDSITNTDRVEVRGYVDSSGAIVAERVEEDNAGGNANRVILQARVTAENGNVLTLLGIDATLSAGTTFEGAPDLATFLAAVTPAASGGTLVKVKGTFSPGAPGTIAAEEAELED